MLAGTPGQQNDEELIHSWVTISVALIYERDS